MDDQKFGRFQSSALNDCGRGRRARAVHKRTVPVACCLFGVRLLPRAEHGSIDGFVGLPYHDPVRPGATIIRGHLAPATHPPTIGPMPTTARHHYPRHTITATCRTCRHSAKLDLAALIASGRGDVLIDDLPLRCQGTVYDEHGGGQCLATRPRFIVGVVGAGVSRLVDLDASTPPAAPTPPAASP